MILHQPVAKCRMSNHDGESTYVWYPVRLLSPPHVVVSDGDNFPPKTSPTDHSKGSVKNESFMAPANSINYPPDAYINKPSHRKKKKRSDGAATTKTGLGNLISDEGVSLSTEAGFPIFRGRSCQNRRRTRMRSSRSRGRGRSGALCHSISGQHAQNGSGSLAGCDQRPRV